MGEEYPIKAAPPSGAAKDFRCCIHCRLIKTLDQFIDQGCENCPFFNMEGDEERVRDATSSEYQGLVSSIDPKGSWTSKWLHLKDKYPGSYALEVQGELPEYLQDIIRR
jgi:transcription elongation factor SPT4